MPSDMQHPPLSLEGNPTSEQGGLCREVQFQDCKVFRAENPLWPGDPKVAVAVLPVNFSHAIRLIHNQFRRLCEDRHKKYGPGNITSPPHPLLGLAYRINDKVRRIFNACLGGGKSEPGDTLDDAFLDLSNYGMIAAMVRKNWWHRPDTNRFLVYVAGPICAEDPKVQAENIQKAKDAGQSLLFLGHFPIIPHTMTEGINVPMSMMLQWDTVLLSLCDYVLQLGDSPGTQLEVDYAVACDIPVVTDVKEIPYERDGKFNIP